MSEQNGVFIVLEGADGSGKGTQFRLLSERLRAVGYEVEVFDFPRYHKTSSHFVRRYLNGDYGPAKDISPYTASLFYALDRYEAAPAIRKALNQGKIVLANRYVGSNMAHQGGKFKDSIEQRGFFVWEDGLEFQLLGIPRPDFNFFLRVPAEISYKLISQKAKREYTNATHDEHEKDIEHLRNSIATYDIMCRLFPKDFQAIECVEDGKLLSIASINDKIWTKLKPILPKKPPHAAHDIVVQINDNQQPESIDHSSGENLQTESTPSSKKVSEDQNITINIKKVSLLALNSVQNVAGINLNIESIEWSSSSQYTYYTQARLPRKIADIYKASMVKLTDLHKKMIEVSKNNKSPELKDALATTIPMAALASGKISGTFSEIQYLISRLQMAPIGEVRWLAQQLAISQKTREFKFARASVAGDFNTQKEQLSDVIAKLVSEHLPQNLPARPETVSLLEARPRNEFDLLVDSVYSYSTSSRADIIAELEHWSYEQKKEALQAAASQTGNPLLQQVRYLWNVICDRPTFDQLKKLIVLNDLQVQPATPRYGYEVPEIIEQVGLDELYIECFDESLKLFSRLQAAGCEDIATYATLLGHKNRWQFTTNAQTLKSSKMLLSSSVVTNLLSTMQEKVAETHPLIGSFLTQSTAELKNSTSKLPKKQDASKKNTHRNRRTRRPKK